MHKVIIEMSVDDKLTAETLKGVLGFQGFCFQMGNMQKNFPAIKKVEVKTEP